MKPIPLKPTPTLNTIEELLADLRAGRMVVLMDDEDRENEGDLIIAAEHVRAEDINFMAHYGRGLICLTLTRERCRQLRLPLMVSDTNVDHRTNFTVSIEAAEGVTTGISAHDRAHTIRTAVRRDRGPHGARAIVRGDARRDAFRGLARHREVRGLALIRAVHHERQAQLLAARARQRQANEAAAVAGHEVDVFWADLARRHDEIALVLAILVVENHDHPALAQGLDDVFDGIEAGTGRVGIRACSHRVTRSLTHPPAAS
jgi:hypothetical protein